MAESTTNKLISVVLIGATGVTGRFVLGGLLAEREHIEKVTVLGRRKATDIPPSFKVNLEQEEESGRLKQHVIDFGEFSAENGKEYFEGQTAFMSCFGTTRRDAGSAKAFREIDYGYNLKFARIAKEANVTHVSLMSTQGANANSFFLYLGEKGKLENAVCELKAPITTIFRPTMLDRQEKARFLEKAAKLVMNTILPETVAKTMVNDLVAQHKKGVDTEHRIVIYENADILEHAARDK